MAQTIMVTRNIKVKSATCKVADLHTGQIYESVYNVNRRVKDDAMLKEIRKAHETETLKIACIVSVDTIEALMGMTEEEFVAHAKVLPPRKTKDVAENADNVQ